MSAQGYLEIDGIDPVGMIVEDVPLPKSEAHEAAEIALDLLTRFTFAAEETEVLWRLSQSEVCYEDELTWVRELKEAREREEALRLP